jgi:hypothetical protein
MATTKRELTLTQLCNKIEKLATGLENKSFKMKRPAFVAHMRELDATVNLLLATAYRAEGHEIGVKMAGFLAAKAAPKK